MCNSCLKNGVEIAVLQYLLLQLELQLTMMPEKSFCELKNRIECIISKPAGFEVPNFEDSMKPR